jgi:transposase-like protein
MKPLSFKRHRFPPDIIRHAIWLYTRFTLSFRDVEELLAERGSACPSQRTSGAQGRGPATTGTSTRW